MIDKRMIRRLASAMAVVGVFGLAAGAAADTFTVYSNNGPPGDSFSSGTWDGEAIGASGWMYGAQGDGVVGINTAIPQSGNGSLRLETPHGGSYAEVRYGDGSSLGALAALTTLSYDWYRDGSASTNSAIQAPALALYVSNGEREGWLSYEPYYNRDAEDWTATTDSWVTSDAYNNGAAKFWSSISGTWQSLSLSDWIATGLGGAGFNVQYIAAYVGSGWTGTFVGAVDNIAIGFGTTSTTTNFEVAPEPSTFVIALAGGVAGLVGAYRRRARRDPA